MVTEQLGIIIIIKEYYSFTVFTLVFNVLSQSQAF